MKEHPLRKFRKENRITLDELALKSGVHKSTLSRIENGLRGPRIDDVAAVIAAVGDGLNLEDFVGRCVVDVPYDGKVS